MRILFLTNFYPPHEIGGQEYSCQQVVEGLQQRGHTTRVLTSMHGTNNIPSEGNRVYRWLYLEMDLVPWRHSVTFFTRRKAREAHNHHCLQQLLAEFEPDLIFIWGMWNLPRSLPALAEANSPGKVVYRFAEYWPTLPSQHEFYWRVPSRTWYSRLPKQLLGRLALQMLAKEEASYPLRFENVICVSAATRDALVEKGIPVSHAKVIYTGLDIQPYLNGGFAQQTYHNGRPLQLLYAGRLAAEKGVDTAIRAMSQNVSGQPLAHVALTVAGGGAADYEAYLRRLVTQYGLEERVTFLGHIPQEEMPGLLRQHDVLLVPSVWQEPFARVVLEGLISGLVVVGTPNGGTAEIIKDGHNGLLFAPGDEADLAAKIAYLAARPELYQRLADAGQQTVLGQFTATRMLDEIEGYLQAVRERQEA